jgi:hypothetical protein
MAGHGGGHLTHKANTPPPRSSMRKFAETENKKRQEKK